jgi:hypothetical protein
MQTPSLNFPLSSIEWRALQDIAAGLVVTDYQHRRLIALGLMERKFDRWALTPAAQLRLAQGQKLFACA